MLVAVAILCASSSVAADPLAVLLDKGEASDAAAFSISDRGVIVGWSGGRATHWDGAGGAPVVDVGVEAGTESYERAINGDGVIVVNRDETDVETGSPRASVWLLVGGAQQRLPSLGAPGRDVGHSENAAGDVAGQSALAAADGLDDRPVIWFHDAEAPTALPRIGAGRGYASVVNDSGMAAGIEDDRLLVVWTAVTPAGASAPLLVADEGFPEVNAMDDRGVIVGDLSSGPPMLWTPVRDDTGTVIAYDARALPVLDGASGGAALSISASGLIGGYSRVGDTLHAVIWRLLDDGSYAVTALPEAGAASSLVAHVNGTGSAAVGRIGADAACWDLEGTGSACAAVDEGSDDDAEKDRGAGCSGAAPAGDGHAASLCAGVLVVGAALLRRRRRLPP